MTALATVADLEAVLRRSITSEETPGYARLLELASARFRREARQQIDFVADDTVTLSGVWDGELWLPERPVTAVTSVTVGDTLLASTSYRWDRSGRVYRPILDSSVHFPVGDWGGPDATVAFIVDHGYVEIPDDVIEAVCQIVVQGDTGNVQSESETIGSYSHSTQYRSAGRSGEVDWREVARAFRPPMMSVAMVTG